MSVDVESNHNGLMFRPSCSSFCLTKSTDVMNPFNFPHNDVIDVVLNNPGDYVIFPASTYHRGYYNHHSHNTFLTAQFFSNYKSRDGYRPIRMMKSDYYHSLHLDPALRTCGGPLQQFTTLLGYVLLCTRLCSTRAIQAQSHRPSE